MIQNTSISAGATLQFSEDADFFRYLEGTAAITVRFYKNGAEVTIAEGVKPGYAEDFQAGNFDRLTITSDTTQTIQFVTRLGNVVNYDAPPTGAVTLSGQVGAVTQAQATVTNASAQLLAAKANRKYLMIQNKDSGGDVYVNLAGAAATTANGVKIGPGDSLELATYCPSAAIFAIGSIASNANVVVVEG